MGVLEGLLEVRFSIPVRARFWYLLRLFYGRCTVLIIHHAGTFETATAALWAATVALPVRRYQAVGRWIPCALSATSDAANPSSSPIWSDTCLVDLMLIKKIGTPGLPEGTGLV